MATNYGASGTSNGGSSGTGVASSSTPPSMSLRSICSRLCFTFFLCFIIMRIFYHSFQDSLLPDRNSTTKFNQPSATSSATSLRTGNSPSTSSSVGGSTSGSGASSPQISKSERKATLDAIKAKGSTNTTVVIGNKVYTKNPNFNNVTNTLKKKMKHQLHQQQQRSFTVVSAYTDAENHIEKGEVTWEEFVNFASPKPRTIAAIPAQALSHLKKCSDNEGTAKEGGDQKKGCTDTWSDENLSAWKTRQVKGLCEDNANSKIHCFDSLGKHRYCVFENAMLNFRKMRKRKLPSTDTSSSTGVSYARVWERGFIAADCGDMAPDDIGYLALYKPDIEGREEAICDYVFNETVVLYSHENTRNYQSMMTDYLNVYVMNALAGHSLYTKDVSFLTIDSLFSHSNKKAKYYGDQINMFFKPYNVTFRRLIRPTEFADSNAKVCFKKLVMQPKPELKFESSSTQCPESLFMSSLHQRYNLQMRYRYNVLPSISSSLAAQITTSKISLLLVTRALKPGQLVQSGATALEHSVARLYRNQEEIVTALQEFVNKKQEELKAKNIEVVLNVVDLLSLPYEEQVLAVSQSSIMIGMVGSPMANSIYMSLGGGISNQESAAKLLCCGMLEIFPSIAASSSVSMKGYGQLARKLGIRYERLDISAANTTSSVADNEAGKPVELGSVVPVPQLLSTLDRMVGNMVDTGNSCILSNVYQSPFL